MYKITKQGDMTVKVTKSKLIAGKIIRRQEYTEIKLYLQYKLNMRRKNEHLKVLQQNYKTFTNQIAEECSSMRSQAQHMRTEKERAIHCSTVARFITMHRL